MGRGGRPYSPQRTPYMQGIGDQEVTDPFPVLASEPGGWAGRRGDRTVPQMHRHKRFTGRLPPNRCPLTESPHHVLLCSLGHQQVQASGRGGEHRASEAAASRPARPSL